MTEIQNKPDNKYSSLQSIIFILVLVFGFVCICCAVSIFYYESGSRKEPIDDNVFSMGLDCGNFFRDPEIYITNKEGIDIHDVHIILEIKHPRNSRIDFSLNSYIDIWLIGVEKGIPFGFYGDFFRGKDLNGINVKMKLEAKEGNWEATWNF